jgi:hypothetical protein
MVVAADAAEAIGTISAMDITAAAPIPSDQRTSFDERARIRPGRRAGSF